ncbi:MAG: hypothetical protein HC878_12900 [Leptolyngbyaceae cyanobacterium SL_5_14]|nr:hypothetical protein [Leptolyngbyaceae cyanobacterium SL_5_14]
MTVDFAVSLMQLLLYENHYQTSYRQRADVEALLPYDPKRLAAIAASLHQTVKNCSDSVCPLRKAKSPTLLLQAHLELVQFSESVAL